MRKLFLSVIIFSMIVISRSAFPCSDVFINFPGMHIEGRTMDFGLNMGMSETFGFIGQKNTTDVIIDAGKIPVTSLVSWTNKYGFWGRDPFDSAKLVDGMNTAGFSLGALYASEITTYPQYDPNDKLPVIGYFDLGSFLLSQAATVDEAIAMLGNLQVVQSAIPLKPGVFLKGVPIHFIMRDSTGNSAVVESIKGKIVIYRNVGNVLTNSPAYPDQVANLKNFGSIGKHINTSLIGLPGGFSSPERFVRASILVRDMAKPYSVNEALYDADRVLDSVVSPYLGTDGKGDAGATIWKVLKDLDRKVVYEVNLLYFQGGGRIVPTSVANNSYTIIDLNSIDFSIIPFEYANKTIQATPPENIKAILSAKDIPEFGE
jgi:choloylglycine hydrolase